MPMCVLRSPLNMQLRSMSAPSKMRLLIRCHFVWQNHNISPIFTFTLSHYPIIPSSHHPTIFPLSHFPIFPLSHYPIIPLSHYPIIPSSHYPIIPLSHYPIIPLSNYSIFPCFFRYLIVWLLDWKSTTDALCSSQLGVSAYIFIIGLLYIVYLFILI